MRDANPAALDENRSLSSLRILDEPASVRSRGSNRSGEGVDYQRFGPEEYQRTIAEHGRTSFNFATRFLPPEKRESTIVLYTFFRTLDDLVDESPPDKDREAIREEIWTWRAWLDDPSGVRTPQTSLASDVRTALIRHEIPTSPIAHFLQGLEFDLDGHEICDVQDLERYCYQVASTVGITMSYTLGAVSDGAVSAASRLGAAMQLTNILRDVGEDLEAGRVFIPTTTLEEYGLSRECLRSMKNKSGPNEAFRAMMAEQIDRARSWYREGLAGVWLLPEDCRFPILVASRIYRRLLTNIENSDYDTLRQRVKTTRLDKAREMLVSYGLVQLWSRDE